MRSPRTLATVPEKKAVAAKILYRDLFHEDLVSSQFPYSLQSLLEGLPSMNLRIRNILGERVDLTTSTEAAKSVEHARTQEAHK